MWFSSKTKYTLSKTSVLLLSFSKEPSENGNIDRIKVKMHPVEIIDIEYQQTKAKELVFKTLKLHSY